MKKHSKDDGSRWNDLHDRIIGLGERSVHKSYYPELQRRLSDLERFKTLLDRSMDALFLLEVPSGRVIDINDSACRQLRHTRESLLQKTLFELTPESSAEELHSLLSQDPDEERQDNILTTSLYRRDETFFPVEISVRITELGDGLYASAIARDLTERIRARQALDEKSRRLSEKERFLRNVFNGIQDGISILDRELNIIRVNAWMEGMYKAQMPLVGRKCYEAYQQRQSPCPWCPSIIAMTEGVVCSQVVPYPLGDDRERWIELNSYPLKDGRGEISGAIQHVRDITERMEAENALKESEERYRALAGHLEASLKEKEVLLREIHHRVKNNMQIVSSLLNLQSFQLKDKTLKTLFAETQSRIRAMALIHEQLYRSESLASVDLQKYVERLAGTTAQAYRAASSVRFDIDIDVPPLCIDQAVPCGLVISELLTNALRHAFRPGEPGKVAITGEYLETEKTVMLKVSDNGAGMPQELNLETSSSLGLTLVKALVNDQLKGSLEMACRGGTTVAIAFPYMPGKE